MSRQRSATAAIGLGLAGLAALSACPGDPKESSNPAVLWLAMNGDELHVRLVDTEPPPF